MAEQHPQFADQIMQAAKLSLERGALEAYLIGAAVLLVGVLVIWFGVPSRARELQMNESRAQQTPAKSP